MWCVLFFDFEGVWSGNEKQSNLFLFLISFSVDVGSHQAGQKCLLRDNSMQCIQHREVDLCNFREAKRRNYGEAVGSIRSLEI